MKINFIIQGKVQAKQRPRFNGKFAYTPRETVAYENWVKTCYLEKYKDKELMEKPLRVTIKAYFEIPKSTSKKKEAEMLCGAISPTKKPDWDNIGKIVSDALNKFAFKDDSQITDVRIFKKYAKTPKVIVQIGEY